MKNINSSTPRARKDHQCNYCGNKINKGEVYESQTNTYEGLLYVWKSHVSCSKLASELNMFEEADHGVNDEYFCDSINENYNDLCIDDLIKDTATSYNEKLKELKSYYKIN